MSSHGHTRTICTGATVSGAFSALHLLRSYSLLAPGTEFCRYDPYGTREYNFGDGDVLSSSGQPSETTGSPLTGTVGLPSGFSLPGGLLQSPFIAAMPPLIPSINVPQPFTTANPAGMVTRHYVAANGLGAVHKRPRSEKKPIPDEQKDEKYYERRKRNNQAAKKSRDARKIREDHIALRATMLEHENAILRAQVITLREEAQSLRHMLIKQQQQQQPPIQAMDRSISSMTPVTLSPPHPAATLDCQV